MRTATIRVEVQGDEDELNAICMAIYEMLKTRTGASSNFGNITYDEPQERNRFGWTLSTRFVGSKDPGFDPNEGRGTGPDRYPRAEIFGAEDPDQFGQR